jgi:hypothetical protein
MQRSNGNKVHEQYSSQIVSEYIFLFTLYVCTKLQQIYVQKFIKTYYKNLLVD